MRRLPTLSQSSPDKQTEKVRGLVEGNTTGLPRVGAGSLDGHAHQRLSAKITLGHRGARCDIKIVLTLRAPTWKYYGATSLFTQAPNSRPIPIGSVVYAAEGTPTKSEA